MLDRRSLLQLAGATALLPGLAFAAAPTERRFVLVLLRGGLDGLHAVAPWQDPAYRSARPHLALAAPGEEDGVLDLDGTFGLHPALAPLLPLYQQRELLVLHAATTRYRNRSHFDGQNLLENGTAMPFGAKDGWLARALQLIAPGERLGLALGPSVPLLLHGQAPVNSWSESPLPEVDHDFLERVLAVYASDPPFADALRAALASPGPATDERSPKEHRRDPTRAATVAGELLARADGPRIAVMESQGWDTHFNQASRLVPLLEGLAASLLALKQGLQEHWNDTAVLVVSEFGRTVAENGTRGTDHGVGGIAFLLGGGVRGGRVETDWPGLREDQRLDGRDLMPTIAYESVFKAVLTEHLGMDAAQVEQSVFPDAAELPARGGLFV